ncbi:MAG: hypothetical protein ACOX8E_01320 [Ruminococcus sp.]
MKDDVSNYALAAGIRARKKDGRFHEGMDGFFAEGQPVQIPLSVIAGWESLECLENRIFIVENPSVYAMLCGQWKAFVHERAAAAEFPFDSGSSDKRRNQSLVCRRL